MFYELLSYRQAFPGDSPFTVVQQILTDQPFRWGGPAGAATGIVRIVDRALEKAPERRYQDLDLMRKDIGRARDSLSGASLEDTAIITLPHSEEDPAGPASHPGSSKSSRRTPLREELARRRKTEQIEEHLRHAENCACGGTTRRGAPGRRTGRLPRCRQSADDGLPRSRSSRDRRAASAGVARSGQAELGAGALTRPSPSSHASSSWIRIGRRQAAWFAIVEARQRKEREAERLRQFQSLLARAKEALDKNEPAAALRAASDALQRIRASTIAKDLHDRAEFALRDTSTARRMAIDQARKRFDSGAHDEALAALASYTPEHPGVDAALTELRAELEAIRKRMAEEAAARRRAEEEQKKRDQRWTLPSELWSPRSAPRSSTMRRRGSRRSQRTKTGRHAAGRARACAHPAGRTAGAREETRGHREFLAEARKQLANGDFVKARAKVDAALALDANDAAVKKLAAEVEAAREAEEERKQAKERDDRAASAVASARRLFADGKPEDALAMLRAYEDSHPAVAAGLAELVTAHEAALKRAREEEEKKRRAAQAQAIAAAIDDARATAADGKHAEASRSSKLSGRSIPISSRPSRSFEPPRLKLRWNGARRKFASAKRPRVRRWPSRGAGGKRRLRRGARLCG